MTGHAPPGDHEPVGSARPESRKVPLEAYDFLAEVALGAMRAESGDSSVLIDVLDRCREYFAVDVVSVWRAWEVNRFRLTAASLSDRPALVDSESVLVNLEEVDAIIEDGHRVVSSREFGRNFSAILPDTSQSLVVPMGGTPNFEGVVVLSTAGPRTWTESELAAARLLPRLLFHLVTRLRSEGESARRLALLEMVNQVSMIATGASWDSVADSRANILGVIRGFFAVQEVAVWDLVDGRFEPVHRVMAEESCRGRSEYIPTTVARIEALRRDGFAFVHVDSSASRALIRDDDEAVTLIVAIAGPEGMRGVLSLTRGDDRRWSDDEVSAARSVARLLRQMTLRVDAEREVRRRLALESLVSSVAADFVDVTPENIDLKLEHTLRVLVEFFDLEQASVWRYDDGRALCRMAYNPNGRYDIEGASTELLNTTRLESRGWGIIRMSDLAALADLPGYSESDHRVLVTAYRGPDGLLGSLVMIDSRRRRWGDDDISAARSISDVFGYARVRLLELRRQTTRHRTDEILIKMSNRLLEVSSIDSVEAVTEVLEQLRDHLGLTSLAVWEIEPGHQTIGCPCEATSSGERLVTELAPITAAHPIVRRLRHCDEVLEWRVANTTGGACAGLALIAMPIFMADDNLVFLTALPGDSATSDDDGIAALGSACRILAQLYRRFGAERSAELRRRAERVINNTVLRFIETSVGDARDPIADAFAEVGDLLGALSLQLWEIEGDGSRAHRREVWRCDPHLRLPGDDLESIRLEHFGVLEVGDIDWASSIEFDCAEVLPTLVSAPLVMGSEVVGGLVANFDCPTIPESELEVIKGVLDSFAALITQMRTRMAAESALLAKLDSDSRLREFATRLVRTASDDSDAADQAFRTLCDGAGIDHASLWRVTTTGDSADISLINEFVGPDMSQVPAEKANAVVPADQFSALVVAGSVSGQWPVGSVSGTLAEIVSLVAPAGERRVAAFGQSVDDTHSMFLVASRAGRGAFATGQIDFFKSAVSMLAEHDNRVTAERWFSAAIDFAPIAISMRNSEMRLISCNPAYERLAGRTLDELRGTDLREVLAAPDVGVHMSRQKERPDEDHLSEEVRYVRPDGSMSWGRINSTPVQLPGRRDPFRLSYIEDTTSSRRRREMLEWQATHDELTGLPNRRLFLRMANARLEESRDHTMLVLDLDRFKVVNDSLGHNVGDQLLITCADRIRLSLRPGDLVCRLGGDEFAILLTSPADMGTASTVADRLLSLLREPAKIADVEVFPSASIGVATPDDDDKVDDLLRHADAAMYQAKAHGRDRWTEFDASMRDAVLDRIRTETDLRLAIDNGQLEVHYQPEVVLSSGVIVGAEALVRWRHPEWGLLTAGSFINVAEESGIVVDLGRWVLGVATKQASQWLSQGHDIVIRVNLSARQVRPALVTEVEEALRLAGLSPDRLCLELTETAIMDDIEESELILARLHDLGVKLAIDDFGTGFSSLAYLKRLPVDILKIDRSFVDGVGVDPDDTSIVESVIGLARTLNLEVVAEGIEDPTQVRELVQLGCDRGQGFHLARPAPAEELELLLQRSRPL